MFRLNVLKHRRHSKKLHRRPPKRRERSSEPKALHDGADSLDAKRRRISFSLRPRQRAAAGIFSSNTSLLVPREDAKPDHHVLGLQLTEKSRPRPADAA
eukprot:687645-Rhodomonas_salina.4